MTIAICILAKLQKMPREELSIGCIQLLGESPGRVGIFSLLQFYPLEMTDGK